MARRSKSDRPREVFTEEKGINTTTYIYEKDYFILKEMLKTRTTTMSKLVRNIIREHLKQKYPDKYE